MDRRSSPLSPRGADEAARVATFEETYPRYEFAELVRLGLSFAAWLAKARRYLEMRRRPSGSGRPFSGGSRLAE